MATPTVWLSPFQVNTGTAATGDQTDPQIIGLANGYILVAWQEATSGAIATAAGTDIVAKIYDAEGNLVKDSFALNTVWNVDNEREFDIAATSDGFAMTFVDDDISTPDASAIRVQEYNFLGISTGNRTIASESSSTESLGDPEIAVDLTDDSYIVTYESWSSGNEDIKAKVVDSTGSVGAEFDAAQNSTDYDRMGDTAVLTNGDFVTVYSEADGATNSLEFIISTAAGTSGFAQGLATEGTDPQVASLAGGGFVATWYLGNDVFARVFDNSGSAVSGVINVANSTDGENESEIVALPGGGFVVVWDNENSESIEGQAFTATGSLDGSQFSISTPGINTIQPNVGVTGDGRLLVTWRELDGAATEIFAAIYDPRGYTIDPDDYDVTTENFVSSDVIVTDVTGSNVLAGSNTDTVLGQDGNDTIRSSGSGEYYGGGGNDYIYAGLTSFADTETLDGGAGTDWLNTATFTGDYTVDLATGATDYAGNPTPPNELFTNFENIYLGSGNDSVSGTTGANIIYGNAGDDTIDAQAGNDTVYGGAGNDTYLSTNSDGYDLVYLQNGDDYGESSGESTIYGGAGNDTILAGLGSSENLYGGSGEDLLDTTRFNGNYEVDIDSGLTNYPGELFLGFEHLTTGNGNDTLFGTHGDNDIMSTGGNNYVAGRLGNDSIVTAGGSDEIYGGNDDDYISAGSGDDSLRGDNGIDTVYGGDGMDSVRGGLDRDFIYGGNGVDSLRGEAGSDIIYGGGGNDEVYGDVSDDFLYGGNGDDTVIGGTGNDYIQGGNNNDLLRGQQGNDTLYGGNGNDTLRGEDSLDLLYGGNHDDRIEAGGGNDTAYGGSGADRLIGGSGRDYLLGGTDNDTILGDTGSDTIDGGRGNDNLTGGTLSDNFVAGNYDYGQDTVQDFLNGTDKLDFTAFGITFADIAVEGTSNVLVGLDLDHNGVIDTLDLDGDTIFEKSYFKLRFISDTDIDASDFLF